MAFFARAVATPSELGGSVGPLDAASIDVPQLDCLVLTPNAQVALVFVETSKTPVLPHEMLPESIEEGERLYWRLVSTDSCEAVCTGALLTLRALAAAGIRVRDDQASSVVQFGMVNARRVEPFTRHIMVPRSGCTVDATSGRGGRPRVRLDAPLREVANGGALHQLVWMCTASGRQIVMDFTGPQYGIEDRLATTGTPCWHSEVTDLFGGASPVRVRGFDVLEGLALFSDPTLPEGFNQINSYIGSWIRDSALGVLNHRRRMPKGDRTTA